MLAVTRMDRVRNDQLTGTVKVELFESLNWTTVVRDASQEEI